MRELLDTATIPEHRHSCPRSRMVAVSRCARNAVGLHSRQEHGVDAGTGKILRISKEGLDSEIQLSRNSIVPGGRDCLSRLAISGPQ
jgi:hypothetical protein